MNSYNDVSLSEVIKENEKVKNFSREINLLVISNINLKSPGEAIIKYVLEKEYKVHLNIESIYDFDFIDFNANKAYEYGVCLYFQDELEEDHNAHKAFNFFQSIQDIIKGKVKSQICIVDALFNSEINKNLKKFVCGLGEAPKLYCELYESALSEKQYYWYDLRNYLSFDCPYSMKGCFEIAYLILRNIRKAEASYKKCIVLDCDNVLWGGVLEEKGMEKVFLDSTYPGNIYYRFQKYIKYLITQGVIIAFCSKNEENEVLNLIHSHPFMLLTEDLVAGYRINWSNKVQNLVELSNELNIELSDFVFIDDSPEEIGIMQEFLPQVYSILFDNYFKFNYIEYFRKRDLFREGQITQEDLNRTQMYKAEMQRQRIKKEIVDEQEFLDSLNLKLTKEQINSFNTDRIVQLSERTHKANLTSRKYTKPLLEKLSTDCNVHCFKLSDKYGDYGYIGAVIYRINEGSLYIEDFYLSCRALGKKIEQMILSSIVEGSEQPIRCVYYNFKQTEKNTGFELIFRKALLDLNFEAIEKVEINEVG